MNTFQIKAGDRRPVLTATLTQDGDALDLTNCTVRIKLYVPGVPTPVVDAACTIVDATSGSISYAWAEADTATARKLVGEFVVTYQDTTTLTVPTSGNFVVAINARTP